MSQTSPRTDFHDSMHPCEPYFELDLLYLSHTVNTSQQWFSLMPLKAGKYDIRPTIITIFYKISTSSKLVQILKYNINLQAT